MVLLVQLSLWGILQVVIRTILLALILGAGLTVSALAVAPTQYGNLVSATYPTFDALYYGAKCNGSFDDSTAIQNAINAAEANLASTNGGGGTVLLPAGTCEANSLFVSSGNITIAGQGFADIAGDTPGTTVLSYNGPSGGTLLTFGFRPNTFPTPPPEELSIEGGGLKNLALADPGGTAATAVHLHGSSGQTITNVSIGDGIGPNFATNEFLLDNDAQATLFPGRQHFSNIYGVNIYATIFNVTRSTNDMFDHIFAEFSAGDLFEFGGVCEQTTGSGGQGLGCEVDTENLVGISSFGPIGGTGGYGLELSCNASSINVFGIYAGGEEAGHDIIARGTATCDSTGINPSGANVVTTENSSAGNTIETGAGLSYSDLFGQTTVVETPGNPPSINLGANGTITAGRIIANAAATASPAPSGYNGEVVIAQATSAPTTQPGYVSVASISGGTLADTGLLSAACAGTNGAGLFVLNASCGGANTIFNAAATPSPAPSGFYGPPVVAQATSAPTAQPGYSYVLGDVTTGSTFIDNAAVSSAVTLNSANSNAANRNWAVLTNFTTYGDFSIRTSNAQGGSPIGGTSTQRLYIDPSGNVTIGTNKVRLASCTDATVGVITCSATVAYTSATSYACGMSYVGPTTTTGAATGETIVNTSNTSVTGTIVGLSLATGTATLLFNCLGT